MMQTVQVRKNKEIGMVQTIVEALFIELIEVQFQRWQVARFREMSSKLEVTIALGVRI
jgi:hypothetical protein